MSSAYEMIVKKKLLSERRMEVYRSLVSYPNGSCTAGELAAYMGDTIPRNDIASRLRELAHLGVARVKNNKRGCRITGVPCLVWKAWKTRLPSTD